MLWLNTDGILQDAQFLKDCLPPLQQISNFLIFMVQTAFSITYTESNNLLLNISKRIYLSGHFQ